MKKIKYVILLVLLLLTMNVNATSKCDTNEAARLKELAKKVEFDYDYTVENGEAIFSIRAVNLNKDLKVLIIKDYFNDDYRQFSGETEATLSGFKSGERVVITIKGFVPNDCSGETVYTKTIKLPYYNIFYNEEKCKGNEDFKYCKILLNNNVTEKDYNKSFETYLNNKNKQEEKAVEEEKRDYTSWFLIIGGLLLIIAIIVVYIRLVIKRRNKNKL